MILSNDCGCNDCKCKKENINQGTLTSIKPLVKPNDNIFSLSDRPFVVQNNDNSNIEVLPPQSEVINVPISLSDLPIISSNNLPIGAQNFVPTKPAVITKPKPLITKVIVSGYVLDEFNNPLPQAHVWEGNNKQNGTITDGNGFFKLKINPNSKIFVSFIGLDTQSFDAQNIPSKIILTGSEQLQEVVVTAAKPKPKPQTASFGLIAGSLLALLALGQLFKDKKPQKASL